MRHPKSEIQRKIKKRFKGRFKKQRRLHNLQRLWQDKFLHVTKGEVQYSSVLCQRVIEIEETKGVQC